MNNDCAVSEKLDPSSIVEVLAAALDAMATGVVISDRWFRVIFANDAAGTVFARARAEMRGQSMAEVVGGPSCLIDMEPFYAALAASGRYDVTVSIDGRGGSSKTLRIACTRIDAGGPHREPIAYVLTAEQVTAKPETDSDIVQLDRMLTRGEMAGEIAHEMNNYLTILLGNLELIPMLLAKGSHDKVAEKVPLMHKTLEKIAAFSESLVDFGRPRECFEIVDLNRMLSDTIGFIRVQNRFDGIRISVELSPDIPPLAGDAGQLQQVIVNLMHNAADELNAAGKSRPTIRIATGESEDGAGAMVTVSDNGRGIPDEVRRRLFRERFTSKEKGEGYGLLVCSRIVERHGGKISFASETNQGTRFEFSLPSMQRAPSGICCSDLEVDEPVAYGHTHGGGPPENMKLIR